MPAESSRAPAPPRRILLADADAFFVAVARAVDPEGAGKAPLLIVGGAPGSRGVVCSASYETRRFGVRSAMPIARALRLCPGAMCVPVPRRACAEKSREIRAVLERFAPVVESASIDEWYLDLGGTERLYHDEPLAVTAARIREAVRVDTGLSVSIGGGTTKLVAKLAVDLAKPREGRGRGNSTGSDATGVYVVTAGAEGDFLRRFALRDFPGIGPKTQGRLERRGLHTVEDVLRHDLATLRGWLGAREAQWLHDRVRGVDRAPVRRRDGAQSISREDTFPEDIADDRALERELLDLAARAAADLRHDGVAARTVTVKLRDADFTTRQASHTLPVAIESDRAIFDVARALLRRLRGDRRVPARLIGIGLSSLTASAGPQQLVLFDAGEPPLETERDRRLSHVMDRLRDRFGPEAIARGRGRASTDRRVRGDETAGRSRP